MFEMLALAAVMPKAVINYPQVDEMPECALTERNLQQYKNEESIDVVRLFDTAADDQLTDDEEIENDIS